MFFIDILGLVFNNSAACAILKLVINLEYDSPFSSRNMLDRYEGVTPIASATSVCEMFSLKWWEMYSTAFCPIVESFVLSDENLFAINLVISSDVIFFESFIVFSFSIICIFIFSNI